MLEHGRDNGDELSNCFQFMLHYPNVVSEKSEFLYFDSNEIFQKFPFLKEHAQQLDENTPLSTVENENTSRLIPRILWEGKTPDKVRNDMRAEGFSDIAIAYVLHNWLGIKNKKEIGAILRVEDITDDAKRKYATKLLKEAQSNFYTE